jgi:hypothetical protein
MFAPTAARAQCTGSNPNSHPVLGQATNNGTYVAPHQRTNPNSTQRYNYSAIQESNRLALQVLELKKRYDPGL